MKLVRTTKYPKPLFLDVRKPKACAGNQVQEKAEQGYGEEDKKGPRGPPVKRLRAVRSTRSWTGPPRGTSPPWSGDTTPCSGRGCVKSLRSSYTGLYPQTRAIRSTVSGVRYPRGYPGDERCFVKRARSCVKRLYGVELLAKSRAAIP